MTQHGTSATATRPVDKLSWLWLAVGLALLPFSTVHTELPLVAWLAPIFVLRFVRTQSIRVGLPVVVLMSGTALALAWRDCFSWHAILDQ
jgi:apolipoprotein N-acyltransferase